MARFFFVLVLTIFGLVVAVKRYQSTTTTTTTTTTTPTPPTIKTAQTIATQPISNIHRHNWEYKVEVNGNCTTTLDLICFESPYKQWPPLGPFGRWSKTVVKVQYTNQHDKVVKVCVAKFAHKPDHHHPQPMPDDNGWRTTLVAHAARYQRGLGF